MEHTDGADMLQTAACGVPGWRKWLCHKGSCSPGGTHTGAGLLPGTVACRELTLDSLISEGLCSVQRIHAGALYEQLQSTGRTHTEAGWEELYPVRRTPCCYWRTVWGGRRSRDKKLLWTDHNPHSLSHCTTEEQGMKEGS